MAPELTPPRAPRRPHPIAMHGETWDDPYFWLRDRDDPATLAYLRAENDYADAVMADTAALQEQLFAEMRARLNEADVSAPVKEADYLYYRRTEPGRQYPICCRRRDAPGAPEEVLLDQNALAEAAGAVYFRLGAFKVSPDGRRLAYAVDTTGAEVYTLYVKDLESGEVLPGAVPNTYYGLVWAADSRTLFYTTLDAAKRPYRLHRRTAGADPSTDTLVYEEPDASYFLTVRTTRSGAYILVMLQSTLTTETRYLPADNPDAPLRLFAPRVHGEEYDVEHHGERFFIRSNAGAENFRLLATPATATDRPNWREVLPERPATLIDRVEAFRDHLVLFEREGGLQRIRVSDPDGVTHVRYVPFPEPVYAIEPGPNPEFASDTLRFNYSSLVTPDSAIDYDMRTGAWEVRKQDAIPSGYDPSRYVSERLEETAPDGMRVPISLVYRRGLQRDGGNPCLLIGYGAYGASSDPEFDRNRLSLLDRGFVVAIGHIRGGAELGRRWYDDGKMLRKKNTFIDFIACAEHLIAQGYTSPAWLAIRGVSAGGLLVGACMTMRPDLFRAVIARVPFVDVINSMSDPSIPLTVNEWEQWGNPAREDEFRYLRSYSPYDNIRATAYPHLLATGALNDPRVAYWEPAKFVAKLRATKTDSNLLLLKTNMAAGHGGASGRYDYLREIAFEDAFLLKALGANSMRSSAFSV